MTAEKIAKSVLGIETLETRKSDRLDFHEVAVWQLKEALEKASKVGESKAVKGLQDILRKIAFRLDGLSEEDATTTERQIGRILIGAGYLTTEGDFNEYRRIKDGD